MEDTTTVRTFLTNVAAVEELSPHLLRIAFEGGDLRDYAPVGPDTFLYVLAAPPGCPTLPVDHGFTWEAYFGMPDDVRPVGAYYTARTWDPERPRLEILVVRHGDNGAASAWAERTSPGEAVALWGPRTTYEPPVGTDDLLVVVDETGIPAAAGIIEQLPAGWTATVVAEVGDGSWTAQLPAHPDVEIRWCERHGTEPGTTTLLLDAVVALERPSATTYVWGGAESRSLTAVRKHVRQTLAHPRDQVSLVAYWRHADAPIEPADE